MPDPVADFLRSLNTSDRARAAAWDAVYTATDDADAEQRLRALPFSNDVKAQLFDARNGKALTKNAAPPPPTAPASAPSRFLSNLGEQLNPITAATGLYQAARHPIDTAQGVLAAQGAQFGKAADDMGAGRYSEAVGHGLAGIVPLVGPAAAQAGEQIASGDVAGGLGKATGLLAPVAAPAAMRAGARALPTSAADALDASAATRVADVMSPKVGANKVRFGNQAERVAPALAQDLAADGAPWTREGFHAQVGQKLSEAEQELDAAATARNPNLVYHTKPIIAALRQKLSELTANTVRSGRVTAGADVIPAPNAARAAQIQQAIQELSNLGSVADFESLRRIRQAYDGPAKAVYSPSMTADYLKSQGGKLGAADVTGVLRDSLAQADPATAAANAKYSLYKTADDVLEATREVERTRPRVGRIIAARIFGTVTGGQAAGVPGAVAGYVAAPIVDAAAASGFTTRLKVAQLQTRLAQAIRGGDVAQVNGLIDQLTNLKRLVPQAGVLADQAGSLVPTAAADQPPTPAPTAQR